MTKRQNTIYLVEVTAEEKDRPDEGDGGASRLNEVSALRRPTPEQRPEQVREQATWISGGKDSGPNKKCKGSEAPPCWHVF